MLFRIAISCLLTAIIFVFEAKPNPYIDSLKQLSNSRTHDSIVYNALNKLAIAYSDSAYSKSIEYWKVALNLSQKNSNRPQMAYLYGRIGQMLFEKGEFNEALESYRNALAIYEYIDDTKGRAISFNDIGLVYKTWGRYEDALENYLIAIKLFNEIKLDDGLAIASNNIGQIYYYRDEYEKAIQYFTVYLKLNQKNGNARSVAGASNNIAAGYMALKEYDLAHQYYNKALIIYDSMQIKLGVAVLEDNIGSLYAQKKKYDVALAKHFKALKILDEINSEPRKAYVLKNIGYAHYKLGDYIESVNCLLKSIEIAQSYKQLETLKEVYHSLSEVYQAINDHNSALQTYKLYIEIKDSLLSIETQENLTKLEMQFESEKKSQELEIVYNKLDQQKSLRLVIGLLIAGFVLISATIIWLGKKSRNKLKKIENQNHNLIFILDKKTKEDISFSIENLNVIFCSTEPYSESLFTFIEKREGDKTFLVTVLFDQPFDYINILKANLQVYIDDYFRLNKSQINSQLINSTKDQVQKILSIYGFTSIKNHVNILLVNNQDGLFNFSGLGRAWLFDGDTIVTMDSNSTFKIKGNDSKGRTFYCLISFEEDSARHLEIDHNIEKTLHAIALSPFAVQKEVLQSTLESMKLSYYKRAVLIMAANI